MRKLIKKQIPILLMILTIIIFPTNAIATEAYSDNAIYAKLLEATGIYNGSINNDAYVTRAEMANFAVLLAGELANSLNQPTSTIYKDVAESHKYSSSIRKAYEAGYISKSENYNPDGNITLIQAIKIVVEVLGYHPVAIAKGGFPYGYQNVSNNLKLTKGIAASNDGDLTYNTLTKLLYNALLAMPMQVAGMKGDEYVYDSISGVTQLSLVFELYEGNGIITQNSINSLLSSQAGSKDSIVVNGETYQLPVDLYSDILPYLGYYIDFFYTDIDNDKNIVCFSTDKNTIEKVFIEDITSFSGGEISYSLSGKDHTSKMKIPESATILFNGATLLEPLTSNFYENLWGDMIFVDAGKTGEANLVSIKTYENYVVSAVDAEEYTIYDAIQLGRKLDLYGDSGLKDGVIIKNKQGQRLGFDAIKKGAVLSVSASLDNKNIEVVVVNDRVVGTVEVLSTDDNGDDIVYVDGNYYKLSPNAVLDRNSPISLGESYVFGLDIGGRIATVEKDVASTGGYVFLIDAAKKKGIDDIVELRIVDGSNRISVLKCASKVKIDGVALKNSVDIMNALSVTDQITLTKYIKSQPIEIRVSDDAKVDYIDTPAVIGAEDAKNSLQSIYSSGNTNVIYKNNPKTFQSYCGMSTNTKVFVHPVDSITKGEDKLYLCRDLSYFTNDTSYPITAYAKSNDTIIADIISINGQDNAGITENSMMFLVEKVTEVLNEEGETATVISGLYNGVSTKYELTNKSVLTIPNPTIATATIEISKGDAIRFGIDSEGKISETQIYYDFSEKTSYAALTDMDQHKVVQVFCAPVYNVKNGFLTMYNSFNINDTTVQKRLFTSSGYKIYVVDGDASNPIIRVGTINDIKDVYTFEADYSPVLLQMRYYDPRVMIIYK